jgi:phage/plasmid-like protein (TIGR03299 family)
MAHRLASRKTGQEIDGNGIHGKADAAFVYVQNENEPSTPWHGLGTSVAQCMTSDEVYAQSGFDQFEPQIGKLFDADMKEIPGFRHVSRASDGYSYGVVGEKYPLVRNRELLDIMDSIVAQDGGAVYDTAGCLFDGRKVFINARLPENLLIAGEEITKFFVLTSAHDGRGAIQLARTPIRVVCQNTLNAALAGASGKGDIRFSSIKHTVNYEERIAEAVKAMNLTSLYYKNFEAKANELLAIKFSEKDFEKLMDQLYPTPADDACSRAKTVNENTRMALLDAFNVENLNNIRNTGWGAYNAVADFSDHMRASRGENKEANAFIRSFEDTVLKDKAMELILAK